MARATFRLRVHAEPAGQVQQAAQHAAAGQGRAVARRGAAARSCTAV